MQETQIQVIDPAALLSKAIETGSSIETMEKLLAMREQIRMERAEIDFRHAMAEFQGVCPVIEKGRQVFDKHGKPRYKFAPLDDIIKQVQPYLKQCGLSYEIDTQLKEKPEGILTIVTVHHLSGFKSQSNFFIPIDRSAYMSEPQMYASAQTFSKRYAFCNAFGILTGEEDNDNDDLPKIENKKNILPAKQKKAPEPSSNAAIVDKFKDQLAKLPDEIKENFKFIGYSKAPAALFCDKLGWDFEKIDIALKPLIIAEKEKSNDGCPF